MAKRKTFVDAHVRRLSPLGPLYRAELTLGDPAKRVTSFRIFSAESLLIARAIGRDTPIAVMEHAGRSLFETFFPADETAFGQQLRAQLADTPWDERLVLRLRIGPPELAFIPWELMAAYPGETDRGAPTNRRRLAIERTFQPLVTLPGNVTLPIRILVASLVPGRRSAETEFDLDRSLRQVFGRNAEAVARSFQATSQSHASVEAFEASLGPTPYDVLHLVGDLPSLRRLDFTRLHRLTSVRLLVLHVRGGEGGRWGALLRVAHRAAARAFPVVIASQFAGSPATAADYYHAFYDGLVHDRPIGEAMDAAREHLRYGFRDLSWAFPALFAAENAHDLLRVSPLADAARRRAEDMLQQVRVVRSNLTAVTRRSTVSRHARSIDSDVEARLTRLSQLEASVRDGLQLADIRAWDHESGGVVPLGNAVATLDTAAAALSREGMIAEDLAQLAAVDATRVVNTYFRTDIGTTVPVTHSIVTAVPYDLVVQIGPRLVESNVRAPVAIPEEVLEPFYGPAGVEFEVAVFSSDFSVDNDRQPLMLGRVGPSPALTFRVTALRRAPSARLRVGIYFKQNLLQCVLVTAEVTDVVRTGLAAGNQAEVEYVLSGDLENIERFPERSLNIVTNERPDGTHTLDVLGSGFKSEFTISDHKLGKGAEKLRTQLLEIATVTTQDPPPYRYNADNSGSTEMLQKDVVALATTGAKFFAALLPNIGSADADGLRDVLTGNATIQVSAVTSARYVFPWAMVYSKRLVVSSSNSVCQTFLDALDHGGPPGYLAHQECIARGCPNDDPAIVCPSGFWGYKHFIEQPPSVYRTPVATAAAPTSEPATAAGNAVLDIVVRGRPNVLMVVNQDLDLWSSHANAIEALRKHRLAFVRRERKTDLGKAIIDPNLHLVYFYCHGRSDGDEAWLGIGAKNDEEAFYSSDLHGWNVRWSDRPLVFINGCQTVECTPDELLPFLDAFLYHQAAGVIGTEIAVPEVLAEKFGVDFLERFMDGREPVSAIVRSLRLSLLEKRNLLGLGYTPYCMGGLRMHVQEAPTLDVLMLEARRSPELTTIETEAPVLEHVWTSAKLSHRIVSNDPRYGGARAPRKAEFLEALRGEWGRVLHLAVHGDGASLALAWSDEPNVATRVPTERLTPREIAGLPLAGTIVVSGACSSGMQTMVDAFARAGARAYVAPSSDVDWVRLVPYFSRFYEQLAAGESVSHCLTSAAALVPDIGAVYADRIGDGSAMLDRG